MPPKKTYIVLNPRGIPAGRHIIRFKKGATDLRWYEGDRMEPPAGCDVARFLRDGFIKEVRAGE